MDIFKFDSYKQLINTHVSNLPKGGHGEFKRIATALKVHTTTISQVFKGDKHLTLDQAYRLALHLGLNELETEYFIQLTMLERESSHQLRSYLQKKLRAIKGQAQQAKNFVEPHSEITKEDLARFYSQWYYSALNLLSDTPKGVSAEEMSTRLNLPLGSVREAFEFLVQCGLNQKLQTRYKSLNRNTHIGKESPLASRHHINWRLRAIEKMNSLEDGDLAFTAPLTISKQHAPLIKQMILSLIKDISAQVAKSGSDSLFALNIDWIEL